MRILLQRVHQAAVDVGEQRVGEIGPGLLALVGIGQNDDSNILAPMAGKMLNLRIFPSEDKTQESGFHRSVLETGGGILAVPQFTLYASCRKGRRPGFSQAAAPDMASEIFEQFVDELRKYPNPVQTGTFGAMMDVSLQNFGPVTIWLDSEEITYEYLDGSTPAVERDRRVDAFQRGSGRLFLISLRAGGFGLNLTGADYVIHMDPWWNPAVEDQASDRAHRIGQTRPVTVYRLVAVGTIEERIVALHRKKRDLAGQLLADAGAVGRLSSEDLLELIRAGG